MTTTYIGEAFEWSGSTSTMKKYYSAGGTRLAMRTGDTLSWLLGDHLGSTNSTANSSAIQTSKPSYKPWGEERFSSGMTPTTFKFTGQRQESSFGLYLVGSRWYDPALGRWAQPDSIVPEAAQGVQAWDRYAYVNNSPVVFNDPSGHMADSGDDGGCNSSWCNDILRQNYLMTLIYKGSGDYGSWTAEDLDYYLKNRDLLWKDPSKWKNPDTETGWDLFALHVQRLATYYELAQQRQFVDDFSLLFGGISQDKSWLTAAWEAKHGPQLPFVNESNDGLAPRYFDSENGPKDNQSHHYVGLFFLSYYVDPEVAMAVNYARDSMNVGDIALGNQAAVDAYLFHFYYSTPSSLVQILLALKNP